MFVLILCALFASRQVDGSLLDPNQFMRELRTVANDVLGFEELQVRLDLLCYPATVLSDLL